MIKSNESYVICRCTQAGVHAGEYVTEENGRVILRNARRVWGWEGAETLSEIANLGCKKPSWKNCKIAPAVTELRLLSSDVCEILECQEGGQKFFAEIDAWVA